MDSRANSTPGVLRLPNEILCAVFVLRAKADSEDISPNAQICSIRLSCRRFCHLSSPLIVRRNTAVDYSRPETLTRLRTVVKNPILAAGIQNVDVRLRFYHPWVAASFENFKASVLSEWDQRRQSWWLPERRNEGEVAFRAVVYCFVEDLIKDAERTRERQHQKRPDSKPVEVIGLTNNAGPSRKVLLDAYRVYKKMYEAQRLFEDGVFETTLAETLSKMPNLRGLTLHDRALDHNHGQDKDMDEVETDIEAQENRLVKLFSQPLIWEDVRWIRPHSEMWPGVPINLLISIPLAIGNTADVIVDHLSIHLSAAPDYTLLEVDADRLAKLTTAVQAMELFQFTFEPRSRVDSGPWEVDNNEIPKYVDREPDEFRRINKLLGAFLAARCIYSVNISLDEFWYSAGVSSINDVGHPLGADFAWPVGSDVMSVTLSQVCLSSAELVLAANGLLAAGEMQLYEICLVGGTWRDALDTLRREVQNPQRISIANPLGGEMFWTEDETWNFAFSTEDLPSRRSRAERFVDGDDIPNPLGS